MKENIIQLSKKLKGARGAFVLSVEVAMEQGEILGIMGPSGEGKSSLLRMVAGLMQPDSGRVVIGGQTWFDSRQKINQKPWKRPVGFVFQEPSLFPHLTLLENLRFALPHPAHEPLLQDLLDRTGLRQLAHSRPAQLSGGQQQRGALVRALVRNPHLLLLDEPFSALDAGMRAQLQQEVRQLAKQLGTTALLVSHDAEEIARVADRVLLLENHCGHSPKSPLEVFGSQPVDPQAITWETLRQDPETGETWWAPKWGIFRSAPPKT